MKIPVKDDDTVPWMSKREIPSIKVALSEWRRLRRDSDRIREIQEHVDRMDNSVLIPMAGRAAISIALDLEMLYAINERLKKDKECK